MGEFDNIRIPWTGWIVKEKLGEGGYGEVYKIERTQHGAEDCEALKIIRIPKNRQEYDSLLYNAGSEDKAKKILSKQKDDIINEIEALTRLRGNDNIVKINGWSEEKLYDGYGWEIYIRMDALTPLKKYINAKKDQNLEEEEVIRLGLDICNALKQCEEENIVHRDIKPDNILVSPSGKFMLTDFGIAKTLVEETTMTGVGTGWYMAPEVARYTKADKTVDLYSLGLVMYELLNNKRLPFLEAEGRVGALERNAAKQRRLDGEDLPEPVHGSDELKRIVLKATMADRSKRYKSAQDMFNDLEALASGNSETNEDIDFDTEIVRYETPTEVKTEETFEPAPTVDNKDPEASEKKKRRIIRFVLSAVALVAVVSIFILILQLTKPENNSEIKEAYEGFKTVATENGWWVNTLASIDRDYAYTSGIKSMDGAEGYDVHLDIDFYKRTKDFNEIVNDYKKAENATLVNDNLCIITETYEGEASQEIVAFKDKMIIVATPENDEGRGELYNLLEALGIGAPSVISGHYLESQKTIEGWNCSVYELDEPLVNAEWFDVGIKLTNVEGDPKGSYKIMIRSDGSWDNYYSTDDIEESDKLYITRCALDSGSTVEALALVPDTAEPDKYSSQLKITGVKKLSSN